MENIEYANSLYQVNEILKYMAPNLKARIPKKFISYFENNKSQNYNWSIDTSLPLEKQNLLTPTKEILTLLYNPNNVFKNKQKNIEVTENTTSIATSKDSFFSKIISKIKLFFHKN